MANRMKAVAAANRFRIWQRARQGYSALQIASLCELAPSTVYAHLAALRIPAREPLAPERMGAADYMARNGKSFFHGGLT